MQHCIWCRCHLNVRRISAVKYCMKTSIIKKELFTQLTREMWATALRYRDIPQLLTQIGLSTTQLLNPIISQAIKIALSMEDFSIARINKRLTSSDTNFRLALNPHLASLCWIWNNFYSFYNHLLKGDQKNWR